MVDAGLGRLPEIEETWSWADLMDARLVIELNRRAERRARAVQQARMQAQGYA